MCISSPGMMPQRLEADGSLGHTFGRLRMVAVPRPRLEIAEFLVHAVELGEQFGDQARRAAMIGEQVVADAVTARSPQQLVAIDG